MISSNPVPLLCEGPTGRSGRLRLWRPENTGAGRMLGEGMGNALKFNVATIDDGFISLNQDDLRFLGLAHNLTLTRLGKFHLLIAQDGPRSIPAAFAGIMEKNGLIKFSPRLYQIEDGTLEADYACWHSPVPFTHTLRTAQENALYMPWWCAPRQFTHKHHPAFSEILTLVVGALLDAQAVDAGEITLKIRSAKTNTGYAQWRRAPVEFEIFPQPNRHRNIRRSLPIAPIHAYIKSDDFPLTPEDVLIFPGAGNIFSYHTSVRLPLSGHDRMKTIAAWKACQNRYGS